MLVADSRKGSRTSFGATVGLSHLTVFHEYFFQECPGGQDKLGCSVLQEAGEWRDEDNEKMMTRGEGTQRVNEEQGRPGALSCRSWQWREMRGEGWRKSPHYEMWQSEGFVANWRKRVGKRAGQDPRRRKVRIATCMHHSGEKEVGREAKETFGLSKDWKWDWKARSNAQSCLGSTWSTWKARNRDEQMIVLKCEAGLSEGSEVWKELEIRGTDRGCLLTWAPGMEKWQT